MPECCQSSKGSKCRHLGHKQKSVLPFALILVAASTVIFGSSFQIPSSGSAGISEGLENTGIVNAAFAQEESVEDYVRNVESLLVQAKEQYMQGNSDTAHQLATEAYLDNYEFVEAPLGAIDQDLMVEVEVMMREELRSMIKDGEDKEKVASHIESILIKMEQVEETLGLDIEPVKQPEQTATTSDEEEKMEQMLQYVENIESLLNQVKDEYSKGNQDKAHQLATEAYLENYEYLEPEIAKQDRDLMVEVEVMIREDLRGMIKDGAPEDEVNSQIDSILGKMDDIRAIVPEFGDIVVGVLGLSAIGMLTMLVYLRKRANKEFSPLLKTN